jgi:hypothetical protein
MTSSDIRSIDSPKVTVADIQQFAAAQLSLPSRMGHVALLVVSLTMAVAVGSLWATEPSLATRTRIAFAVLVSLNLGWAVFATWVLARRRVLLGTDRVVAATMALGFSTVCAAGMLAVGYWGGVGTPAYTAALVESPLCIVAAMLLVRARRRVDALRRRQRELEMR